MEKTQKKHSLLGSVQNFPLCVCLCHYHHRNDVCWSLLCNHIGSGTHWKKVQGRKLYQFASGFFKWFSIRWIIVYDEGMISATAANHEWNTNLHPNFIRFRWRRFESFDKSIQLVNQNSVCSSAKQFDVLDYCIEHACFRRGQKILIIAISHNQFKRNFDFHAKSFARNFGQCGEVLFCHIMIWVYLMEWNEKKFGWLFFSSRFFFRYETIPEQLGFCASIPY